MITRQTDCLILGGGLAGWMAAREAAALATPLDGGAVRVDFDEPQRAAAPGQAAVLYEGDIVLGGGTIVRAF